MSAAFLELSGLHGLLYKPITLYSSALPETFKSVELTETRLKQDSSILISKMKSKLAIFDFDHTIKHPRKGWQMGVSHFFPDGEIPEDIHQIRKEQGWDSFCKALYTKVI